MCKHENARIEEIEAGILKYWLGILFDAKETADCNLNIRMAAVFFDDTSLQLRDPEVFGIDHRSKWGIDVVDLIDLTQSQKLLCGWKTLTALPAIDGLSSNAHIVAFLKKNSHLRNC